MPKPADGFKRKAKLFRALSHPVRLRILDVLARQEACVCHLTALLGQRQPYISQQLATLREAGLVTDRREGTLIFYQPATEHLPAFLAQGRVLAQELVGEELIFPEVAETLDDCPCPRCQGQS